MDTSDLEKIEDAMTKAEAFFKARDEMNAQVHLGQPRWSPITSLVIAERERVTRYLQQAEADGA